IALALGNDAGIDSTLFSDKLEGEVGLIARNRMAPNTAFGFVLAGASLLHYRLGNGLTGRMTRRGEVLAVALLLLAVVPLLGYVYEIKEFYGLLSYIPMAFHTALGFLLLSVAMLFAHPHGGFMVTLTEARPGSYALRLLLPFA